GIARGDTVGLEGERELLAIRRIDLAGNGRVIPRLAGDERAGGIGALRDDILQRGIDAARRPAHTERDMERVHAEITHTAVFAIDRDHTLPVDLLGRVKVAAVQETALSLDDLAEASSAEVAQDALGAGEERKFRRAGDGEIRLRGDFSHDFGVGRGVDAEWLLAKQVFS